MIVINWPWLSPDLVNTTNQPGKVVSSHNWQENPGNCKIKNEYLNLDETNFEPWESAHVVMSCLKIWEMYAIYDLSEIYIFQVHYSE